jgi:hypothetical protein
MIDLDCGDSSCRFALTKTGQRTNGGCRCLAGLPLDQRVRVTRYIQELRHDLMCARELLQSIVDGADTVHCSGPDSVLVREAIVSEHELRVIEKFLEVCDVYK